MKREISLADRYVIRTIMERNVGNAIAAAVEAHGSLTDDYERAMVIMTEEVGELAAEVLTMTRPATLDDERADARQRAITEAAQVAAVAILTIFNLERTL